MLAALLMLTQSFSQKMEALPLTQIEAMFSEVCVTSADGAQARKMLADMADAVRLPPNPNPRPDRPTIYSTVYKVRGMTVGVMGPHVTANCFVSGAVDSTTTPEQVQALIKEHFDVTPKFRSRIGGFRNAEWVKDRRTFTAELGERNDHQIVLFSVRKRDGYQ